MSFSTYLVTFDIVQLLYLRVEAAGGHTGAIIIVGKPRREPFVAVTRWWAMYTPERMM